MSRSLSPKLLALRQSVLQDGQSLFVVTRDGALCHRADNWHLANEWARESAYRLPGSVFVAQERRRLDTAAGEIVAVKRARSWASYGVVSMEEYAE